MTDPETPALEKDAIIDIEITSLTNLGEGIGRYNGCVVMIPFTIPGETVRAKIFEVRSNYARADLLEVSVPSEDRIDPVCPIFGECGGCQYQHIRYERQLDWKHRHVSDCLERLAGITFPVDALILSPAQYEYRSKLTPHYGKPRDGQLQDIGFLRQGRRRQLVDVPDCPIALPSIRERLDRARKTIREKAAAGVIRRGGTLLLRAYDGGVTENPKAIIHEKVGSLSFSFPAGEFFQNNPFILEQLLGVTGEMLEKWALPYLVDAYCGSGLFSIGLAQYVKAVLGIEISEKAVTHARKNALANNLSNSRFLEGDAAALFSKVDFPAEQTVVLLDPPRRGCDESFLEQLFRYRPARIIYVSCDPATQARDLKEMISKNYSITRIQPFDLFPQTRHIENVVFLQDLENGNT